MTALDIFVLLLIGGGAVVGFLRGFTHEVLSLAAWIAGIVILKAFHTPVQAALAPTIGTQTGAAALAFALLFLPTFFLVKFGARSAGSKAKSSVLIGATLFFLLANLATDLISGPQAKRPEWLRASRTYPLLNASGRAIVDWVETRRHPGVKL
jgi:membrane protein required for colicin V production